MLGHNHFYWNILRKYVVAFSKIVDDIHVLRTENDGTVVKDIKVPLTYAAKTKLFYYLQRSDDQSVSITLPRISYLITDMQPDPERRKHRLNERVYKTQEGEEKFLFDGSPWDFTINLGIWTKYYDDMLQIVEQVSAFFDPEYVVTIKEIPELGVTKDVPIVLNSVTFGMETEFGEENNRTLITDMTFTLKGWLYKPISDSNVIHHIKNNYYDKDTQEELLKMSIDYDELTEEITQTVE
jgi:hypothetical protein